MDGHRPKTQIAQQQGDASGGVTGARKNLGAKVMDKGRGLVLGRSQCCLAVDGHRLKTQVAQQQGDASGAITGVGEDLDAMMMKKGSGRCHHNYG